MFHLTAPLRQWDRGGRVAQWWGESTR